MISSGACTSWTGAAMRTSTPGCSSSSPCSAWWWWSAASSCCRAASVSPAGGEGGALVELQADECHRPVWVAGIKRLQRGRHEILRDLRAEPEAEMRGDADVADRAERELADSVGRAVMAGGRVQLVVFGIFGAA